MKNIVYLILAGFTISFISCTTESANIYQEKLPISEITPSECNIHATGVYNEIGTLHNELMDMIPSTSARLDNCSDEEVEAILDAINIIIEDDADFSRVFSTEDNSTFFKEFVSQHFKLCELETDEEVIAAGRAYSDELHLELSSLGVLSKFELDLIDDIMDRYLSIEQGQVLDINDFYLALSNNQNQLYRSGEFTYTLLAIIEHSFCYWTNEEGVQTRWFRWNPIFLVADAVGAYAGGVHNLITTEGQHDPDNELLTQMGDWGGKASFLSGAIKFK